MHERKILRELITRGDVLEAWQVLRASGAENFRYELFVELKMQYYVELVRRGALVEAVEFGREALADTYLESKEVCEREERGSAKAVAAERTLEKLRRLFSMVTIRDVARREEKYADLFAQRRRDLLFGVINEWMLGQSNLLETGIMHGVQCLNELLKNGNAKAHLLAGNAEIWDELTDF